MRIRGIKWAGLLLLAVMLVVAPAYASELPEQKLVSHECEVQVLQNGGLLTEMSFVQTMSTDDEVEEQLYDLLCAGLQRKAEDATVDAAIDISSLNLPYNTKDLAATQGILCTVYAQVINDHPEWFFLTGAFGYQAAIIGGEGIVTNFVPTCRESYDNTARDLFQAAVDEALREAKKLDSELVLERIIEVHNYLVANCAYNWDVATYVPEYDDLPGIESNVYCAYGALVDGDAVCQGYATAFKVLLNELGIGCEITSSDWMNHAWNLVELDGEWYHVDVTWDDPSPNREGGGNYDYFLVSDWGMLSRSHYGWIQVQECGSKKYEEGYAFNDAQTLIYRWNEEYYYMAYGRWENRNTNVLYKGDLDGEGEAIAALGGHYYSALWLDGQLYYVDGYYAGRDRTIQVMRCDLATGERTEVGEKVAYEQTPYVRDFDDEDDDGRGPRKGDKEEIFSAAYDMPGLRLDETGSCIEVVSATRREVVHTVKIGGHPASWDDEELAEEEHAKFVGAVDEAVGLIAGILVDDTLVGETMTVLAAVYCEGRMTGLRWVDVRPDEQGLMVVELGGHIAENETYSILLAGTNWTPVCGAMRMG